MLFNTLDFAVFFAVIYGLYLLLPHRGQNRLLLVGSYLFYGSWDWRFLGLLLLSTVIDYVLAQKIEDSTNQHHRKVLVTCSMVASLTILGFFKYYNFFIGNLEGLLQSIGLNTHGWHLNVILPWGISFYTFQTMNYTIDVYRKHLKASRNFEDFALFVSFFPHLVAGPIMRASVLLPQVMLPRRITRLQVEEGGWLILWGLFKKMVVADNLAPIVDTVFAAHTDWNSGTVLLGVYAFAFQIYCDFSGYSDMARGISKLMGFELMINFRNPYFALNPSDFWRRWHISLSTWLRDYLYIPLGGNKKGIRRTYINLILTMLLGGLWHGAAWTFVIWGAFHGSFLAVHRWLRGEQKSEPAVSGFSRTWRIIGMFHAVCFGWLLFRAASMGDVMNMLHALFTQPAFTPECAAWLFQIAGFVLILLVVEIMQEKTGDDLVPMKLSVFPRSILYSTIVIMLITVANTGSHAFIYFQF